MTEPAQPGGLVLLQEAVETPAQHQAAEVLGDGYHFVHHSLREPDGRGISAASRWPVRQVRELDLHVSERTAGFARSALLTEIAAPPPVGPLLLVNHLPNWQLQLEYERGRQAVITAQAVEELVAGRDLHVVLAGDFDADWDWPFRRIDYIFVRCGGHGGPTLAIRDCRRIFDQPVAGARASDHFGVCADLVTPQPLPPAAGRPGK